MTSCIDRVSAAEAAHDRVWVSRQHKCAAVNARTLAGVYRALIPLLKRTGVALKAAGGSQSKVSRSTVLATIAHPSAAVRKQLAEAGVSPDVLLVAQSAAKQLPRLPSSAISAVAGTRTIHAMSAAAKAFQQIARENQAAS
jgi:hypothetical protein